MFDQHSMISIYHVQIANDYLLILYAWQYNILSSNLVTEKTDNQNNQPASLVREPLTREGSQVENKKGKDNMWAMMKLTKLDQAMRGTMIHALKQRVIKKTHRKKKSKWITICTTKKEERSNYNWNNSGRPSDKNECFF